MGQKCACRTGNILIVYVAVSLADFAVARKAEFIYMFIQIIHQDYQYSYNPVEPKGKQF